MAHVRLRDTDDYKLENKDQDVRGWPVRDTAGKRIGSVADLLVNTDAKLVETLILEDGREIPVEDVYIGDQAVYLESMVAGTEVRPLCEVFSGYGRTRHP